MVWKKALVLSTLLVLLSSCDDIRDIEICKIGWVDQIASCARNGEESERDLEELDEWYAVSETDLRKIATKLEECERDE
jgi:hypothetical protein